MYNEFEEFDLKAKLDFSTWKRILKELIKYKWLVFVSVFSMIVVAFVETIFVYYISTEGLGKFILDNGEGTTDGLLQFVLLMALLALTEGVFVYGFIKAGGLLEIKFYSELTKKTFHNLQNQSFSFFDRSSVGWLMARVSSDTSRLGEIISWGLIDIVYAIFKLIFVFITMALVDFKLSLVMLIIVPIVLTISIFFRRIIIKNSRQMRKINSQITSKLNEGITGAKTTITLVLENQISNVFLQVVNNYKKVAVKSSYFTSGYYQIIAVSAAFALAIMAYFGGMSSMKASILFMFLSYSSSFFEPVLNIARLSNEMKHAQVAAERVFSLNDIKPELLDTPEVIEKYGDYVNFKKENFEELYGDVEFDNVSFAYKKGQKVLDNFNLKIKKGQSVALVGETGAGKSTIINLLSRFYEPTSGIIKIDGKDYKERSIAWLHSHLGYVLQSPHLFSGTIKENIRYGRLDASDEEVYEAARIANAEEFIMRMPNGYDSQVGEGGNRLSLGQKQLISFARAIIANPKIMILDEATSSIDTQTEYAIQKAIKNILKGRTSFIVAHRLSTIINSDLILVIKNGKIYEQGTHQELMDKKGYYYKLYTNQFIEEKLKEMDL